MNDLMSITVIAIYVIFFAIMMLFAMIPAVINGIGLARICKRLGAFRPVWCWVWAILCPPIAVLRAGDLAGERRDPVGCRRHFGAGVLSVIVTAVITTVATGLAFMCGFAAESSHNGTVPMLFALLLIVLSVAMIAIAIWMSVLLYISYFRIFRLYVPGWGAWLLLAGMILLSQFSFLILPILSFLPMRED